MSDINQNLSLIHIYNNHRLLHCNRTSNCFVTYMTIHTAARF